MFVGINYIVGSLTLSRRSEVNLSLVIIEVAEKTAAWKSENERKTRSFRGSPQRYSE